MICGSPFPSNRLKASAWSLAWPGMCVMSTSMLEPDTKRLTKQSYGIRWEFHISAGFIIFLHILQQLCCARSRLSPIPLYNLRSTSGSIVFFWPNLICSRTYNLSMAKPCWKWVWASSRVPGNGVTQPSATSLSINSWTMDGSSSADCQWVWWTDNNGGSFCGSIGTEVFLFLWIGRLNSMPGLEGENKIEAKGHENLVNCTTSYLAWLTYPPSIVLKYSLKNFLDWLWCLIWPAMRILDCIPCTGTSIQSSQLFQPFRSMANWFRFDICPCGGEFLCLIGFRHVISGILAGGIPGFRMVLLLLHSPSGMACDFDVLPFVSAAIPCRDDTMLSSLAWIIPWTGTCHASVLRFCFAQLGAESISFIDAKQSLGAVDKGTNLRGVGLRHKPFASCMPLLVFGFFWWRLTYWTALRSFTSSLLRSLNSADGHV